MKKQYKYSQATATHRAATQRYRDKNKEKINQQVRENYDPVKAHEDYEKRKVRMPDYNRQYSKERIKRIRLAVFKAYGNTCACCGETTVEFLSVDHKGGWGKDHRDAKGKRITGYKLYEQLIREGFPEGFRLLCYNCNCSLGFHGYCPHDLKG